MSCKGPLHCPRRALNSPTASSASSPPSTPSAASRSGAPPTMPSRVSPLSAATPAFPRRLVVYRGPILEEECLDVEELALSVLIPLPCRTHWVPCPGPGLAVVYHCSRVGWVIPGRPVAETRPWLKMWFPIAASWCRLVPLACGFLQFWHTIRLLLRSHSVEQ